MYILMQSPGSKGEREGETSQQGAIAITAPCSLESSLLHVSSFAQLSPDNYFLSQATNPRLLPAAEPSWVMIVIDRKRSRPSTDRSPSPDVNNDVRGAREDLPRTASTLVAGNNGYQSTVSQDLASCTTKRMKCAPSQVDGSVILQQQRIERKQKCDKLRLEERKVNAEIGKIQQKKPVDMKALLEKKAKKMEIKMELKRVML